MEQTDVLGRRIGAAIIDIGVVLVIVLLVGGIVGNDTAPGSPDSARFGALDRLLILILAFGYYWATETLWQQTPGKRALGIHVVRTDGSKPSAGATFVRTLLRIVDSLPAFYIVGLVTIFATGSRRQRVGDLAAKTRVVAVGEQPSDPAARPERPPDEDVLAQIMR
jgi:uncharacterized RDD family membrane protein YckC